MRVLCYLSISKFGNNPFGYTSNEEQYVTNPKDIILLNYNATLPRYLLHKKRVIASYETELSEKKSDRIMDLF
jgi:hypothetical protein